MGYFLSAAAVRIILMLMLWLMFSACNRPSTTSNGYGFEIEDTQAYNRKLQAGYESLSKRDQEYVTRYARRVKVVKGPVEVDPRYGAGRTSHAGMDLGSKTILVQGEWLRGAEEKEVGKLILHEAAHREYYEAQHLEGLDLTPKQIHRQMEARGL